MTHTGLIVLAVGLALLASAGRTTLTNTRAWHATALTSYTTGAVLLAIGVTRELTT